MPSQPFSPARRRLRGAALALALTGVGAASAACGTGDRAFARTVAPPTTVAAADHDDHHGTPPPASVPPEQVRYVSLGDSYTAAPWTGPAAPDSIAGCDQSEVNYPHAVATSIGSDVHQDVSCTGATTADLFTPQALAGGQEAPPQLDAVTEDTTLVTLGIGGNDIGFADIIINCLAAAPDAAPCKDELDGPEGVAAQIAATAPKIASVLASIAERAPAAEILVVGYPTIFPAAGACYETIPFTDADVAFLAGVERELNAMLAAEAERADATYVDTETTSAGHDACAPAGVRWIEGLRPEAEAMPFHPNALGAAHAAERVLAALGHDAH